jgi:hypothetical protein
VLAKELSFTRAAQKLFVSQPPLSLQIANLEQELGSKLFYRTSRSVKLSEAGKVFLTHCQSILDRLDQACDHVKQVEKGLEGQVQIGLSGSHFMGPLPYFIGEFRAIRPKVEIILREMKPADHLRSLYDGGVDISVLRNPSEHPDLSAHLLWRDPVMAVLPLNHRLAKKRKIHLKDLRDESMVLLHPESSAYAQSIFDACIAEDGEFPVFPGKIKQNAIPHFRFMHAEFCKKFRSPIQNIDFTFFFEMNPNFAAGPAFRILDGLGNFCLVFGCNEIGCHCFGVFLSGNIQFRFKIKRFFCQTDN